MAAPVTLGYWAAPTGNFVRLYVNGLPLAGGKAWLEKKRGAVTVSFSGEGHGLDQDIVLSMVRAIAPGGDMSWDALIALAQSTPSRRGPYAGATAASRRGGKAASSQPWQANAAPWTTADVEATPIDMATNRIPEPTRLLVDHREPAEMIDHLREVENLIVEVAQLEVGDYVVPGKLIVERKTAQDLVTSVTEDAKRLFFQTEAMAVSDAPVRVLLLEGDIYGSQRLSLQSLMGTLSFIAVIQGASVLPTFSLRHSAIGIAKMVRHACFGLGYDLGLRGSGPKDPAAAAAYVLQGVPGVSATRAIALLKHFGSLSAIAVAPEAALRAVDGIGAKTAALIVATFRAPSAT